MMLYNVSSKDFQISPMKSNVVAWYVWAYSFKSSWIPSISALSRGKIFRLSGFDGRNTRLVSRSTMSWPLLPMVGSGLHLSTRGGCEVKISPFVLGSLRLVPSYCLQAYRRRIRWICLNTSFPSSTWSVTLLMSGRLKSQPFKNIFSCLLLSNVRALLLSWWCIGHQFRSKICSMKRLKTLLFPSTLTSSLPPINSMSLLHWIVLSCKYLLTAIRTPSWRSCGLSLHWLSYPS